MERAGSGYQSVAGVIGGGAGLVRHVDDASGAGEDALGNNASALFTCRSPEATEVAMNPRKDSGPVLWSAGWPAPERRALLVLVRTGEALVVFMHYVD